MKKILWLLMLSACGCSNPDNTSACLEAEEAIEDAWRACGEEINIDLACDEYEQTALDCTASFNKITDTAQCINDGDVFYEAGDCAD